MNRTIILLVLLIMSITTDAAKHHFPGGKCYIYRYNLCDKAATSYSLNAPQLFLSEKSIERRQRQGLPIDSTDLPVCQLYIKQFNVRGAQVVGTSKWQNTVLVQSNDSAILNKLGHLDIVRKATCVFIAPDSIDSPGDVRWNVHQEFNRWDSVKNDPYGMARNQIEMLNGIRLHELDCTGRGISIAVIDGATPKGNRLWEGMRGDVYISHLISNAIKNMDRDITAEDAVLYINNAVKDAYKRNNVDLDTLEHEEMLQACVVIYSASRHEVWSYGDCLIRINHRDYNNIKKLDVLMSNLRAFFIESAMINGNYHYDSFGEDFGRKCILPYLKEQGIFANTNYSFGYSVINGGTIIPKNVKVYSVQSGDRIILATDGYPKLFDTLEASEQYLELKLKEDPDCVYSLRGTKGVSSGNVSFDDRAFIGFSVD